MEKEKGKDKPKFDWLIVGAGLAGAVFANEMCRKGYSVCVVEKRKHVGGNCYTYEQNGIDVHAYGAHIFRTSSKAIWDYVNSFTQFNTYNHKVLVNHNQNLYTFPINLKTLHEMFLGVTTPDEGRILFNELTKEFADLHDTNLENHCLKMVGREIYETFIKGYTEKQWGAKATDLPASIIKRIPIRMNFNDSYFADNKIYQGIPNAGYTEFIKKLLAPVKQIHLDKDYFSNREYFNSLATNVLYTGPLDEYFDYSLGELGWRSLCFDTEYMGKADHQGIAVMNYTSADVLYTRVIEHKHFNPSKGEPNKTVITHEYPLTYYRGYERYYPLQDDKSQSLADEYRIKFDNEQNNVFRLGRLADYAYYDMDDVIIKALSLAKNF